jgi:alkylation response protein AidB-like acyl-CoA dehydrogenase
MGPTGGDLLELVRRRGGVDDRVLRQRLADVHIHEQILGLIRLRTVSAAIRGRPPGPEASVRKVLADEHGQRVMALAHDLCGAEGLLTDGHPLGDEPGLWHFGFLFSQALTIGGGTGDVQRNIVAERVLGLPHDLDVEAGLTWAESHDARRLQEVR